LLGHTPPVQFEAAEAHYREVLRLDEAHAPSYVGLGRLRDLQGRHDEAASAYEKAIQLDPDYAVAYERYGQSLLAQYIERAGGRVELTGAMPEVMVKARGLLAKSVELDPKSMNAHAAFGKTFMFGDEDVSAGIASLTTAARALPARTDILYDLLVLQVRAGNRTAARSILKEALRYRADDELLALAEMAVLSLDLKRAEALLAEGKLEESMAVFERVADETRDPELEQQIRARLAATRSFNEAESILGLYNHAMDTINAGNYEEALVILEQLVPRIDSPELKAEGERQIAELREVTRHNRLVGRYNRAVQQANAGDLDGAVRLLEQILADRPDQDLRQKAEAVLSDLKEQR
jgi:tetratricopeptide (TPR) repeat protein